MSVPEDVTDAYDHLADDYVEEVEEGVYTAELAFPGTVEQIPAVANKRVLDAGCGTGAYTGWLLEQGADVIGIDASSGMLDRAHERFGDRATLQQADFTDPLPFDDGAFDGVVSVLVLSYIEDWQQVLGEFARVLDDGGFLVLTVVHPFDEFPLGDGGNYFETERRVKDWGVAVPYYRRPLEAMVNPLLSAGFSLERIVEPQPTGRFRERWPERYEKESRQPVFLTLRARK